MRSPLEEIPGVGKRTAAVMESLGIHQISDLQGRNPEELYLKECMMKGFQEDRCALYVWRTAVYYAENGDREPEKLKWWYWKDKVYLPGGAENHEFAE